MAVATKYATFTNFFLQFFEGYISPSPNNIANSKAFFFFILMMKLKASRMVFPTFNTTELAFVLPEPLF